MSAKDGRNCKTRGFSRRGRRDSTKRVAGKPVRKYVHVKVGDRAAKLRKYEAKRLMVEAAHCS